MNSLQSGSYQIVPFWVVILEVIPALGFALSLLRFFLLLALGVVVVVVDVVVECLVVLICTFPSATKAITSY